MTKQDLRATVNRRADIRRETTALEEVLSAIALLGFDQARRVLRWACDYRMIDPTKLPLP